MLLENQGLTESSFVPLIRSSLSRQLVVNPIASSAVVPKTLVEDIYRYRNEQRVADTVTIPDSAATNVPAPTDADVDTYYKAHAVQFTAPEYRTFTVLSLTPDLFVAEIKPTDDELHAVYDQHKAEYIAPEKRKITQLVLSDKASADAVAKAIQPGKTLADAAKTAGGGKVQPITLDFLAEDEYPEALRAPVFAAAKDAIVGPVQTPLGWHVIHIDDVQAGHDVPFDQVKNILIDQVKHDSAVDKLSEQIDKLGDKLVGGTPMETIASGLNATPIKIASVNAKGEPGVPDSAKSDPTKPAPAKPKPDWTTSAFQLQQGETSAFQDDKEGGYYAVRLDGITPPSLRPLAEVRVEIVTDWTKEQQAAQIVKRAQDLAAKARAGTPLSQIASEAGLTVETTAPVMREPVAGGDTATPALTEALFQLNKVGDIVTVDGDNGQIIARLKEIRPADPAAAGSKLIPIEKELSKAMQADSLEQYRAGLRESTKVKINPRAVETVAGQ
jgi:peptidyl-prolyl cis-trans isomerase D